MFSNGGINVWHGTVVGNTSTATDLETYKLRFHDMNINILIAFLFGMIILAATPGPGVLASMSKAIAEGFAASLVLIGGLVVGDVIFLLAAFLGLSALAQAMGEMFLAIRIIGGLYLMYLGIKAYGSERVRVKKETGRKTGRFQTFMAGLLVTMGNPKPILFYASVLPTIIDFRDVKAIDILAMVVLIAVVSFSVLGTYCYLASLTNRPALGKKWQMRINRVAGLVMIVAGIFVMMR
jgi:threonine/homoserine/homoserine lactone efflux protein